MEMKNNQPQSVSPDSTEGHRSVRREDDPVQVLDPGPTELTKRPRTRREVNARVQVSGSAVVPVPDSAPITPMANEIRINFRAARPVKSTKRSKTAPDMGIGRVNTTENRYEISRIVDYKIKDRKELFKIKWKGWASIWNSWEQAKHVDRCENLVRAYFKERPIKYSIYKRFHNLKSSTRPEADTNSSSDEAESLTTRQPIILVSEAKGRKKPPTSSTSKKNADVTPPKSKPAVKRGRPKSVSKDSMTVKASHFQPLALTSTCSVDIEKATTVQPPAITTSRKLADEIGPKLRPAYTWVKPREGRLAKGNTALGSSTRSHNTTGQSIQAKTKATQEDQGSDPDAIGLVDADKNIYYVGRILDYMVHQKTEFYLAKWKGWPSETNTWEPYEHLNCPAKVKKFFKRNSDKFKLHQHFLRKNKSNKNRGGKRRRKALAPLDPNWSLPVATWPEKAKFFDHEYLLCRESNTYYPLLREYDIVNRRVKRIYTHHHRFIAYLVRFHDERSHYRSWIKCWDARRYCRTKLAKYLQASGLLPANYTA